MRTIKFRGEDIAKRHRWLYGSLIIVGDSYHIIEEEGTEAHEYNRVHKETICQFTGLRDLQDKDIYEGDVLRTIEGDHLYCTPGECDEEYEVDFEESNGRYALVNLKYPTVSIEFSKHMIETKKLVVVAITSK